MILSRARTRTKRSVFIPIVSERRKITRETKADVNTNLAFLRLLSTSTLASPSSSSLQLFHNRTRYTDSISICNNRILQSQRMVSTATSPAEAFGKGARNHLMCPDSKYKKYLEHWSLASLVSIDDLVREDDPENDLKVSKITIDFLKRIEIQVFRLADLQQRVEDFHSRLLTLQSNRNGNSNGNSNGDSALQDTIHMVEGERKILRDLQRLHYDTWESVKNQYMQWSPDGDDDIDNDDECLDPILLLNPKERRARWNSLVSAAKEIQARHAMTIEQMSELIIRLKALRSGGNLVLANGESFDEDFNDLYDVVCAFLRCRMTQQLLAQHLMAMAQDALGTSTAKKIEARRKADLKAGRAVDADSSGKVVGAINLDSPVAPVVKSSVTEASQLCEATYLVSPPVAFVLATDECGSEDPENNHVDNGDHDNPCDDGHHKVTSTTDAIYENVSVTFVRSWLQYTLIELLKNAMAATVESNPEIVKAALEDDFDSDSDSDSDSDHDSDSDSDSEDEAEPRHQQLPYLYLHIFEESDGDHVVVKIYDQGGGIHEDFELESLFRFAQRDTVWDRMDEQQTYSQVRSPLKGLGVGLSLSRWHMRHFSGDLTLERRPEGAVRIRKDSGRRSKWHVLGKGMTATIKIPKNASIPLVIS